MSYVAFHSPERTVRIHGPERAHALILTNGMLTLALGVFDEYEYEGRPSRLRYFLPQSEQGSVRSIDFQSDLQLYLSCWKRRLIMPEPFVMDDCGNIAMNTAIVAGSNPIRFLVWMYAYCECYGFVEGHDRSWLASIINEGLRTAILRKAYDGSLYERDEDDWWGWQRLVAMLDADQDMPIVMSHSTGDTFPNKGILQEAGWENYSSEDEWNACMAVLRSLENEDSTRQSHLSPATIAEPRFGEGLTGYNLMDSLDGMLYHQHKKNREG